MIDLLLVLLLGGSAALGWQRGLVVSLCALGAFVAAGLPALAIAVAVGTPPAAVAFLLGGMLGLVPVALNLERITDAVEARVDDERWRIADRVGGALCNLAAGVVLAWFVGAVVWILPATSPSIEAVRNSTALGALVQAVPPQGDVGVAVLRSGLVPSLDGPLVLAEAPDPAIADLPAMGVARSSVVQVRGHACNELVTGTAWVAGPGLLLTNAHVVAGMRQVTLAGGPRYAARPANVTYFDPYNDVAVLTLEGTSLPPVIPLSMRVQHGELAAAIGFPLGGEQQTVPARIDRVASWETRPVGGGEDRETEVLAFRAEVRQGNSGGPVVAADGVALGMVVARGIGQRLDAAYGVPASVLAQALAQGARRQVVSTGPCIEQ